MKVEVYEHAADARAYMYFVRTSSTVDLAHFHNSWELLFMISGELTVTINKTEYALKRGDIAISNALDIHYYHSGAQPYEAYVLLIGREYFSRFLDFYGKEFENFLPACGKPTEDIFRFLSENFPRYDDLQPLSKYGLIDMLLGLMAECYAMKEPKRGGADHTLVQILRYIDEHSALPLSIQSVADVFGYSKTYFSALFNQYTGTHFRDYLNRIRVGNAIVALDDPTATETVASVALRCGFDSLNTFYRAKKKFIGEQS